MYQGAQEGAAGAGAGPGGAAGAGAGPGGMGDMGAGAADAGGGQEGEYVDADFEDVGDDEDDQ